MSGEFVSDLLSALGGATVITIALAHFLGKIWTKRIIADVEARHASELEALKQKAQFLLKHLDSFSSLSQRTYQKIFEKRVRVYEELLSIKGKHLEDMLEDPLLHEYEQWGTAYYYCYEALSRKITKNQLYISTDLNLAFEELQGAAAEHIRKAKLAEIEHRQESDIEILLEAQDSIYKKLAEETQHLLSALWKQMDVDVAKLRSRTELDKTEQ